MQLDSDHVAQYLKDNPSFFDEYAELLAEIFVPHPHGGHAIPIAERQIVTLRDRNRQLEERLAALLKFGQDNDTRLRRMHRTTLALLGTTGLDDLATRLQDALQREFDLPCVAVRIWWPGGPWQPSEAVRRLLAESGEPRFSPQPLADTRLWFPGDAHIGSTAWLPFHGGTASGLAVMGSPDPDRWREGMDSDYLARLAEVAGAVAARCAGA